MKQHLHPLAITGYTFLAIGAVYLFTRNYWEQKFGITHDTAKIIGSAFFIIGAICRIMANNKTQK